MTDFWIGFLSNLFATLIGVYIGIYFALEVEKSKEAATEQEKKKKILSILYQNLGKTYAHIRNWKEAGEDASEMISLATTMSDEAWRTFSDGGETQWIKDPTLLYDLAETYGKIKYVRFLSDKYFDAVIYEHIIHNTIRSNLQDQLKTNIYDAHDRILRTMEFMTRIMGDDIMSYMLWG